MKHEQCEHWWIFTEPEAKSCCMERNAERLNLWNAFKHVKRSFFYCWTWMRKLIYNRCTAAFVYAHEQLRLCFCFSPLFCSLWFSPVKMMLKQLFASGSVNNGEYSPRLSLGEYSPVITLPSVDNCQVWRGIHGKAKTRWNRFETPLNVIKHKLYTQQERVRRFCYF